MFDSTSPTRSPRGEVAADALALLGEGVRPVSASRTQVLPVLAPLRDLLPEGGLRRGSTIGISADHCGGGNTIAMALMAAASMAGSWCAAVGLPDLGPVAADELQIDLRRLAFVPLPGVQWGETVAAVIEGVDVVLLRPPPHVRATVVRRLVARLRDRRAVLIILIDGTDWSEGCDVELRVDHARWVAIGRGEDCLRERLATVTAVGRRSAVRPVCRQLWLPDMSRTVAMA